MLARCAVVLVALITAVPAVAGEMKPEEARRFVAGKLFNYRCFDGTSGSGRINNDGSVAGTMRPSGTGQARFMLLPPNTLQVRGNSICASVKGVFFEPCFNLVRTSDRSFRGSIAGFGFAYCDFVRRSGRAEVVRASAPALRRSIEPAIADAAPPPAR